MNNINKYIFESENSEKLSEIELVWELGGWCYGSQWRFCLCNARPLRYHEKADRALTCQTSYFKILTIWVFVKISFSLSKIFVQYSSTICPIEIMCAKYFRYYKTFGISREGGHFHMKYLSRYWNVRIE